MASVAQRQRRPQGSGLLRFAEARSKRRLPRPVSTRSAPRSQRVVQYKYKKGSRKTSCPFLPRTMTPGASLRGLLELSQQRLEHVLVFLLGLLVLLHVFIL